MPMNTDEEFLRLLRSEEAREMEKGMKKLYQSYFQNISNFITQNSGSLEDAEDVFQEGILVLFNQVKDQNFVLTSKLKNYFYSICRYAWLNKLKQSGIRIEELKDFGEPTQMDDLAFKNMELSEEKKAMLELLQQLGEDCQQLLLHYYYDRFNLKEIAVRMDYASDEVVENKKAKCLKQLKQGIDTSSFFKKIFK